MPTHPQKTTKRLYKREKLCSQTAIDTLFARGPKAPGLCSLLAYPLRAVWLNSDTPGFEAVAKRVAPVPQFMISVPKKRLRHAIDRVRMRRLVREAWRLNRDIMPQQGRISIAFVYVGATLEPYTRVERAVVKILKAIASDAQTATDPR